MLTDFKKYNEDIAEFEKSALYKTKYSMLLTLIFGRSRENSITSGHIERALSIGGAQVRDLVRHARLKGIRIGSSGAGYFHAKNTAEIGDTIKHLEERRNMLDLVIYKLHIGGGEIKEQEELFNAKE
jgi:hypothetical protein